VEETLADPGHTEEELNDLKRFLGSDRHACCSSGSPPVSRGKPAFGHDARALPISGLRPLPE
jgi:hypothetical protein